MHINRATSRRSRWLAVALVCLLIAAGCGGTDDSDGTATETSSTAGPFAGTFDTTYGEASLSHNGDAVVGTYEAGTSDIIGTADGDVVTGTWSSPSAASACDTEFNGTVYWGRIIFTFESDGSSFDGLWSYCDAEPTQAWDGTRVGGSDATDTAAAADDAEPALVPLDTSGERAVDPPLVAAVFAGDTDGAVSLLGDGADPDIARELAGATPLLVAAQEGELEIAQALIDAGADLDRGSDSDLTPLLIASDRGHADVVDLLIQSGANVLVARADNYTALHVATYRQHLPVIELLLAAGSPRNPSESGWSPLTYAAQDGFDDGGSLLLKAGADPDGPGDGPSPLYLAAQNGHETFVALLLDAGASPDNGGTQGAPLIQAAAKGRIGVLSVLVDGGADVDVAGQGSQGYTALMWAANNNDEAMVLELLRLGADPSVESTQGKTALAIAEELGNTAAADALG